MRVLGIDPGTATLGWGVVEHDGRSGTAVAYGAIRTPSTMAMAERLKTVYHELTAVIAAHHPDGVAVEELFFGHNVRTALSVGQARGVCLLAIAEAGVPLTELKPAQVKLSVSGYGGAGKAQVERMVVRLLRLKEPPKPDDVADALAIALTGFEYWRRQAVVGGLS